jgi:hypothetical protein
MVEMVTLGTVAIVITSFVFMLADRPVKQVPGFFYLVTYFGKIHQPKWCTVFVDQVLKGDALECEVSVPDVKAFLWKIEALLNKIKIGILHRRKL